MVPMATDQGYQSYSSSALRLSLHSSLQQKRQEKGSGSHFEQTGPHAAMRHVVVPGFEFIQRAAFRQDMPMKRGNSQGVGYSACTSFVGNGSRSCATSNPFRAKVLTYVSSGL